MVESSTLKEHDLNNYIYIHSLHPPTHTHTHTHTYTEPQARPRLTVTQSGDRVLAIKAQDTEEATELYPDLQRGAQLLSGP